MEGNKAVTCIPIQLENAEILYCSQCNQQGSLQFSMPTDGLTLRPVSSEEEELG